MPDVDQTFLGRGGSVHYQRDPEPTDNVFGYNGDPHDVRAAESLAPGP